MALYNIMMYPLEQFMLKRIRKEIISKANGVCLEIAFGTGVNMPYYDGDKIKEFHAIDIFDNIKYYDHITYHVQSAESLPFEDGYFDSIVLTLGLCTIPDIKGVLSEISRCVKDDGLYIFLEHEQAESKLGKRFFNLINPTWSKYAGGCKINLNTTDIILSSGFGVEVHKSGIFRYGFAKKLL